MPMGAPLPCMGAQRSHGWEHTLPSMGAPPPMHGSDAPMHGSTPPMHGSTPSHAWERCSHAWEHSSHAWEHPLPWAWERCSHHGSTASHTHGSSAPPSWERPSHAWEPCSHAHGSGAPMAWERGREHRAPMHGRERLLPYLLPCPPSYLPSGPAVGLAGFLHRAHRVYPREQRSTHALCSRGR